MRRLPFDLSIPTPCHQHWHEMSGTPAQRHCASCNKTVHNLATLTPRQIERVIHASNGHLCARITRSCIP
jgi:ribosomal protein L34E